MKQTKCKRRQKSKVKLERKITWKVTMLLLQQTLSIRVLFFMLDSIQYKDTVLCLKATLASRGLRQQQDQCSARKVQNVVICSLSPMYCGTSVNWIEIPWTIPLKLHSRWKCKKGGGKLQQIQPRLGQVAWRGCESTTPGGVQHLTCQIPEHPDANLVQPCFGRRSSVGLSATVCPWFLHLVHAGILFVSHTDSH